MPVSYTHLDVYKRQATKHRVPFHPDVPALAELPGFEDYDFAVWIGFFVSASTPRPIVDKLSQEFMALAQDKACLLYTSRCV